MLLALLAALSLAEPPVQFGGCSGFLIGRTPAGAQCGALISELTAALHNPLAPQSSPHAASDPFTDETLDAKWTDWDPGADAANTQGTSEGAGRLYNDHATTAGNVLAGKTQDLPGDTYYTITADITLASEPVDYNGAFIFIAEDLDTSPTTGNIWAVGPQAQDTTDSLFTHANLWDDYQNFNSTTGTSYNHAYANQKVRIAVDTSGGTAEAYWSPTGEAGSWKLVASISTATIGTLAKMGIATFEGNTGRTIRGVFRNFEYRSIAGFTDSDKQHALGEATSVDGGDLVNPIWSPLVPEDSPATESDDFAASGLDAKWTEVNVDSPSTDATLVTVAGDGKLVLVRDQLAVANSMSGVWQADSGDTRYSITTKITGGGSQQNFWGAYLAVGEDWITNPTTSGAVTIGPQGSLTTATSVSMDYWNNQGSYGGNVDALVGHPRVGCYRLVVDTVGGTIIGLVSNTGRENSWIEVGRHAIGTDVASVDAFGLIVKSDNTTHRVDPRAVFENFEYKVLSGAALDDVQHSYGGEQSVSSGTLIGAMWNPWAPEPTLATESDDFSAGALDSKWTELDNDTTLTISHDGDGYLVFDSATSASSNLAGVYQSMNADTEWMATTWIDFIDGGSARAGIFIAEDLDAAPTTAQMMIVGITPGSSADTQIAFQDWTDYNSFGSTSGSAAPVGGHSMALRLAYESGGDIDVLVSHSGEKDSWVSVGRILVSSWGGTPATFGLYVNNADASNTSQVRFRNFEYETLSDASNTSHQRPFGELQSVN